MQQVERFMRGIAEQSDLAQPKEKDSGRLNHAAIIARNDPSIWENPSLAQGVSSLIHAALEYTQPIPVVTIQLPNAPESAQQQYFLHDLSSRFEQSGFSQEFLEPTDTNVQDIRIGSDSAQTFVRMKFGFNGNAEITKAVASLYQDGVSPEHITEDAISERMNSIPVKTLRKFKDPDFVLFTGQPDPDAIEFQGVNLWQASYAELAHTPKDITDFTRENAGESFASYTDRSRRFGGLPQTT